MTSRPLDVALPLLAYFALMWFGSLAPRAANHQFVTGLLT
jgi:hypothetical protein